MSEVIDLAKHVHRRELANSSSIGTSTGVAPVNETIRQEVSIDRAPRLVEGATVLSAEVIYRLDPQTELGQFFELASTAIKILEECQDQLNKRESFSADDLFMKLKLLLTEMVMLRSISDSVGLICWKAVKLASAPAVISEHPVLVEILTTVLKRLRSEPFMAFAEASMLAENLEKSFAEIPATIGYVEMTNALLHEVELGNT